MSRIALVPVIAIAVITAACSLYAATLLRVSDLISTSAPSATSTHTIQFVATTAIPASGTITIEPQSGALTIPASLDYTDVDVAVSPSGSAGPYAERDLAASASATDDGVSIASGSSGSIVITLNSTIGIAAGYGIRIRIGTNATHGAIGDIAPVNSATPGMYSIRVTTANSGGTRIDYHTTFIAIVRQVAMTLESENVPPSRSSGLPSGDIAAGNSSIEISLITDEPATCRYATSTAVLYSAMTSTFSNIQGFTHYTNVTGHQNSTTYSYYVRCIDVDDSSNDDDYEITFTLKATPESNTSIQVGGSDGNGGVGQFPGGSSVLFLASVRLSGWSSPDATVIVLKDGKQQTSTRARADGGFELTVAGLERGAYTFLTYAIDRLNRRSATYSSTLTLSQGSTNVISDIVTPPTVALENDAIALREDASLAGETVPGSTVEIFLSKVGSGSPKKYTASASKGVEGEPDGIWSLVIPAKDLAQGTYSIRARTIYSLNAVSDFGTVLFLGVGESPSPDLSLRADLNGDGKVNLVDFSILLSFWGTSDSNADINSDGDVGLADFSIMLFNWTG